MVINILGLNYFDLYFQESVKAPAVLEAQNLYFIYLKKKPSTVAFLTHVKCSFLKGDLEKERLKKVSKKKKKKHARGSETIF